MHNSAAVHGTVMHFALWAVCLVTSVSVTGYQERLCSDCSSTWHNAFVDIFHDSLPLLPQLWRFRRQLLMQIARLHKQEGCWFDATITRTDPS